MAHSSALDQEQLRARCAELQWFHAIDFGDFATSGRFPPGGPQNVTLYGAMQLLKETTLEGATVLDIGALDGLATFAARKLGAAKVVATCSYGRKQFRLVQNALGLESVEYRPGLQIKDFAAKFERGAFDAILCMGVVYHMLNPLSAFTECRKIIKDGGLFIVESAYAPKERRPVLYLNSEAEILDEVYTYSVPSKSWLLGAMRLCGFDVLAVRALRRPARLTVLGRACAPDAVRDRTPLTQAIHARDFVDFEFKLAQWAEPTATSMASYRGPGGERRIDPVRDEPMFPFHPPKDRPAVGRTAWMTAKGNTTRAVNDAAE